MTEVTALEQNLNHLLAITAKIERDLKEHLLRANPPRLMSTVECAQYLGVSKDRLFQLRREGGGPKYCQPTDRWVRYRIEDVDAWVKEAGK